DARNYRGDVTRDEVLTAHGELLAELEAFAREADADLAALIQPALLETVDRYEQLKERAAALDFVDLLLRARDLVRDRAEVRADLQRRLTHIFVDEFQDTDPLQAEIVLLLSASDPAVASWQDITPAPGKLFLVGDPKQSIYRFRRADVGTYQAVKDLLVARGAARRCRSRRATCACSSAVSRRSARTSRARMSRRWRRAGSRTCWSAAARSTCAKKSRACAPRWRRWSGPTTSSRCTRRSRA